MEIFQRGLQLVISSGHSNSFAVENPIQMGFQYFFQWEKHGKSAVAIEQPFCTLSFARIQMWRVSSRATQAIHAPLIRRGNCGNHNVVDSGCWDDTLRSIGSTIGR
jgi:hypothetical protein